MSSLRRELQLCYLAQGQDTAICNLYYSGVGYCGRLARELFWHPEKTKKRPTASRSRSRPATHLCPALAGELFSHALRRKDCQQILRKYAVSTNRIRNEWTGVSFSRFLKLSTLLESALNEDRTLAISTWLRWVYERRLDFGHFLDGIDSPQDEESALTMSPDSHGLTVILDPHLSDSDFFTAYSAGALWLASQAKAITPFPIRTVQYKDKEPKPDCVEVCLRELIRMVEPEHILATNATALEWFSLCQSVPGAQFLSGDYELAATPENFARAFAYILFGIAETITTIPQLAHLLKHHYNINFKDESRAYTPRFGDALKLRHILIFSSTTHALEIHLEQFPPIAIATYRTTNQELSIPDSLISKHLDTFFAGRYNQISHRVLPLRTLWLNALLSDRALEDDRFTQLSSKREDAMLAILAARLGPHDRGRWLPLVDHSSNLSFDYAHSLQAQRRKHTLRLQRALELTTSLLSPSQQNVQQSPQLGPELGHWLRNSCASSATHSAI